MMTTKTTPENAVSLGLGLELGQVDDAVAKPRRRAQDGLGPELRPWQWMALASALLALGIAGRLLPHAPNFSPAASIALFAGFLFPSRWMAAALIFAIMIVSDARIGGYDALIMAAVYASLLFPLTFRDALRKRTAEFRVIGAAASSSLVFFAATNLAVWFTWYPQSWEGLADCYTAALPFFRWTLAGDFCWTLGLFGLHALVIRARASACDPPFRDRSLASNPS